MLCLFIYWNWKNFMWMALARETFSAGSGLWCYKILQIGLHLARQPVQWTRFIVVGIQKGLDSILIDIRFIKIKIAILSPDTGYCPPALVPGMNFVKLQLYTYVIFLLIVPGDSGSQYRYCSPSAPIQVLFLIWIYVNFLKTSKIRMGFKDVA